LALLPWPPRVVGGVRPAQLREGRAANDSAMARRWIAVVADGLKRGAGFLVLQFRSRSGVVPPMNAGSEPAVHIQPARDMLFACLRVGHWREGSREAL